MAFKMNGFSAGAGTGSASTMKKTAYKKEAGASPLTIKPPKNMDGVKRKDRKAGPDGQGTWTKVGVDKDGADEFGLLDRKSARQSERKTSRAESMQDKATKLTTKQNEAGTSDKKKARLQARIDKKTNKANKKLNQAANIQSGRTKNQNATTKKGSYVKPGGKATGEMKDYKLESDSRKSEYDSRGWKYDDTIKGYKKDGTKK